MRSLRKYITCSEKIYCTLNGLISCEKAYGITINTTMVHAMHAGIDVIHTNTLTKNNRMVTIYMAKQQRDICFYREDMTIEWNSGVISLGIFR